MKTENIMNIETTTTTTNKGENTMTRANRISVKYEDGHLKADFFRTHKHITQIMDSETEFIIDAESTKSANRENFRSYVAINAATFGIDYDPTDRRTEYNQRLAKYITEDDVTQDALSMVVPDIERFMNKLPHRELIESYTVKIDTVIAKVHTAKGVDLSTMGIEDGKYLSNGHLAWFDIEGIVTMTTIDNQEIYQAIEMELVSGQLKKFKMTQTQWNTGIFNSLLEVGLVQLKEEKPKKESPKEVPEEVPVPEKPKRIRKPRAKKVTEEKVEG